VELSLNLWLCGDGIDVLSSAVVSTDNIYDSKESELSSEAGVRLAAAWMDLNVYGPRSLLAIASADELSEEELKSLKAEALQSPTLPAHLIKKCRPFEWYADKINPHVKLSKEEAEEAVNNAFKEDAPKQPQEKRRPSKPLDPVRLEIVQKAAPMDIVEKVVMPAGQAPHLGAKDSSGKLGYIHDETALRKNHPNLDLTNKISLCAKGDANYQMLTEKVMVDFSAHEAAEKAAESGIKPRAKIFCSVYTIAKNHHKLSSIHETWG
jgi:hypothetical protein